MNDETRRLLRECAVDLIRAADLTDEMALFRIGTVMNQLGGIRDDVKPVTQPSLIAYMEKVA